MELAIDVSEAVKTYPLDIGEVLAVDRVSLRVARGEFVAVVGRSGSGKTTLLNLLAGIDRPTSGTVRVEGADLGSLRESRLAPWRVRTVGLVFQLFELLPILTVAENVMVPMAVANKIPERQRPERARWLLDRLGIGEQADNLPTALSEGQRQRTAVARALANDPPLVLADEPTGNLDSVTARAVVELLIELNTHGRTIVVVTRQRDICSIAGREVTLVNGRVASDETMQAEPAYAAQGSTRTEVTERTAGRRLAHS